MEVTTVTYLVPDLRLYIGDLDPTQYAYLDVWLESALVVSVKTLQKWWNYKYLVDNTNQVYRNTNVQFLFPEPPVIENGDERAIVLMASIIIKNGTLQNSAWNTGSWKDAEISYSNIEGSRLRQESLKRDWDELSLTLKAPQKRLINALKSSLPGYKDNPWEVEN